MNNRFNYDAADALISLEAMARPRQARNAGFRDAERARWARAQPKPIVSHWAPTISERERQEREALIQAGLLPF